jgi:hypothetical protein
MSRAGETLSTSEQIAGGLPGDPVVWQDGQSNVSERRLDQAQNSSQIVISVSSSAPRWTVILAWSTGPAGLYALLGLAHAAFVEQILSVDVGFGRTLAFWIGSIYLALPIWGFLPRHLNVWYARRRWLTVALAVGAVGAVTSTVYAALWLRTHWVASVGGPVVAAIAVLVVAATGVLWLAGRDDRRITRPD